jgi:hypothetical protein
MRALSQSARSPESARFLCPSIWPGFSTPVSRRSFRPFDTQDGLI